MALCGFMAAGKSTVGRSLAHALRVPFVDTDREVASRYGPIDAIFARDGESCFRAAEYESVCKALDGPVAVIALGGGAVTYEPTRALLAERAFVVYLQVSPAILAARLRRSKTVRPLVGAEPSLAHVRSLLATREPLYRQADLITSGAVTAKTKLARDVIAELLARGIAIAS